MASCITCGAEADYISCNQSRGFYHLRICNWCARQLPSEIVEMADGQPRTLVVSQEWAAKNPIVFEGTWTKENWMNYPSLVERRREVGTDATVVEDCYKAQDQERKYPHTCPKCGSPAYIGLSSLDCSKGCK